MNLIPEAFQRVLAVLDRMEILYAVGGSVASGVRGNYRYNNDIDILVGMPPEAMEAFVAQLGPDFRADAGTRREAFRLGRPWNIISARAAFKFDLIPAGDDTFAASQLARRTFESAAFFGQQIEFAVVTSEDILLSKLRWFRKGHETSEQQWRDILGIAAIQGPRLDRAYLDQWAARLGVADLLARVLPLEAKP